MAESEGVIKFHLDYEVAAASAEAIDELNVLRSLMFQLGMVGQDPTRYDGYGFGNLSMRCESNPDHFIITGTQTGHMPELTAEQYVTIEQCDIAANSVVARGPVKPSSEALTHAMIYQLNPSIKCVIHAHKPELWRYGLDKGYPCTDQSIEYGTVQMAQEIERLNQNNAFEDRQLLVMAGHEDGVISFGDSIDEAGMAMLQFYVDVCS